MGQLTVILLAVLGQTGSVTATPSYAVGGSGQAVQLQLVLSPAAAKGAASVRFDVFGVGEASEAKEEGGGRFTASYTPPPQKYPQVAIVRAEVTEAGRKRNVWGSVPIYGVQTLKLTTKPAAKVEILIGALRFQSDVPSDSKGRIEVPVQVPPGVETGRARSTDRLGNRTEKPVDLNPPPFARARVAPSGRDAVASWADERSLPLEIFAVRRDGTPAGSEVTPFLDGDRGKLEPVKSAGAALWTSAFRAPESVGNGKATVRVRLKERGRLSPEGATLEIAVRAGTAKRVELTSDAKEIRADEPRLRFRAEGFDERDNDVGPADEVTASFGTVKPVEGAFLLEVPSTFGSVTSVTINARSGRATASLEIALKPGLPATGAVAIKNRKIRAGAEPVPATLELRDARGNPVNGAKVQFASALAKAEVARELGDGKYALEIAAGDDVAGGESALEVKVEDAPLQLSVPVTVLPPLKPGTVTVGAWLAGRKNFGSLLGGGGTLEVGVLPARLPLEALLSLTYVTFGGIQSPGEVTTSAQLSALQATLGGRWSFPVGAFTAAHATAQAGVQRVAAQFTIPNVTLEDAPALFSPIARVAGGFSVKLGPGRLAGELGYGVEWVSFSPDRSNPATKNLPEVSGNLGGLQLGVGYVVQLR